MLDDDHPPPSVLLFRALVVLGQQLRTRMDQRLAEVGLTTQQATVLTLAEGTPPPTLGAIASVLGTSHQNARQIVDALVRKGLAEVRVDPEDRRARRVVATAAVSDLFSGREASDRAAIRSWFSALSDREIEQAVALLRKVGP